MRCFQCILRLTVQNQYVQRRVLGGSDICLQRTVISSMSTGCSSADLADMHGRVHAGAQESQRTKLVVSRHGKASHYTQYRGAGFRKVPQKLAKQFCGGATALDALQSAYRERGHALTAFDEVYLRACEQHELAAYLSSNMLFLLYKRFMVYTRPGRRPWLDNAPGVCLIKAILCFLIGAMRVCLCILRMLATTPMRRCCWLQLS